MRSRREEMLKEMGIAPLWRLRKDAASGAGGASTTHPTNGTSGASATHPASFRVRDESPVMSDQSPLHDDRRTLIMRMDWTALKDAVTGCRDCVLHAKRNKAVFGVGDENAEWLFVGEGPGAEEDVQGEPFVGQAGKLLDNMLAAVDLKRGENVYICNVVKCRPPGNRNPEADEAQKCEPFLQRQIELIKPKLIVALGRVAALNLLAREASIASLRGKVLQYKGTPLIVTYHPAYLLRNLADKAKAWEDLCFAVKTMESLRSGESAPI
jgi:DNA polymerase